MCVWRLISFPLAFWLNRPQLRSPQAMASFYVKDGDAHYEFQWDYLAQRPTTNRNGAAGFARVISRSCGVGGLAVGFVGRVHQCKWNPCRADHPRVGTDSVGRPCMCDLPIGDRQKTSAK